MQSRTAQNSRMAPARLRKQASWLINQNSMTAQKLVTERLSGMATHRYQYSMLAALDEFGEMSQAALGRRCGLDRSDVASGVTDMVVRGFVERAADPDDQRRNIVRVIPAGVRHLQALDRLIASAQDELLKPLASAERKQLIALLARLTDYHANR
jgi:MarR family transcriptional regulator, lower aerobic nicotinate degradation pathway regulator